MTIKCKAVLFSTLVIRMMIGVGLLALVLFLTMAKIVDYLYLISMVVMFSLLIYVFYLDRFELLFIGMENESVHFGFVNTSIYKRKDIKTTKDSITVERKDDKLLFYINNELQAILRKASVNADDWNSIVSSFVKS